MLCVHQIAFILTLFATNTRITIFVKEIHLKNKSHNDLITLIAGYFNTSIWTMEWPLRKKIKCKNNLCTKIFQTKWLKKYAKNITYYHRTINSCQAWFFSQFTAYNQTLHIWKIWKIIYILAFTFWHEYLQSFTNRRIYRNLSSR